MMMIIKESQYLIMKTNAHPTHLIVDEHRYQAADVVVLMSAASLIVASQVNHVAVGRLQLWMTRGADDWGAELNHLGNNRVGIS